MSADSLIRRLLTGGAAAGPLFVGAFLVEGATRDGYDPLRHPVSDLALGPKGWQQTANFTVAGVLYLGFAAGLALAGRQITADPEGAAPTAVAPPRLGTVLLGASAVGLLGSAAFVTDPIGGYPPGTPAVPLEPTATGRRHDLSAMPVFIGLPIAQLSWAAAFRRAGKPGWARFSTASAALMTAGFGLATAGFVQTPRLARFGGLFQRMAVVSALGWQSALAVHVLRHRRKPG